MIVPRYWAEARRQERVGKKQFTVRRFGWSNANQAEAEAHAAQRLEAAWADVVSGKIHKRREVKVKYNGADGLPIREEIIGEYDDTVITRNSYGAKCLNTTDVFFADIDFFQPPQVSGCMPLLTAAAATGILWSQGYAWYLLLAAGVATND